MSFIATGTAAGIGLIQTGIGVAKGISASNKRKKAQSFFDKNKFSIPESAKGALSLAQRNASSTTLPGEDLRRAQLGETTARGVGAAKTAGTSSADILTHLSSLFGGEQRGDVNMGIAGANRFDSNQRFLGQELNKMAGYETDKWKYNVLYPYQQMMGQAGQMEGQGNQMISGGVGTIGQAAATYGQMNAADTNLEAMRTSMGLGKTIPKTQVQNYFANRNVNLNQPAMNTQIDTSGFRGNMLDIPTE